MSVTPELWRGLPDRLRKLLFEDRDRCCGKATLFDDLCEECRQTWMDEDALDVLEAEGVFEPRDPET